MNLFLFVAGLVALSTLFLALLAFLKKSSLPAIAYTQTKPLTEPEQTSIGAW